MHEPSVLVVDDDADLRATLQDALTEHGFAVSTAANGQEALRYLRASGGAASLILLDLMMPVMNGWQFRREQEQDPALAAIPVLVLSAGNQLAEAANAIGVAGFIRKPVDLGQLVSLVALHCRVPVAAS